MTIPKVWALPANENWICDQLVDDWNVHCSDIATRHIDDANILWLIADWSWRQVPEHMLKTRRVVTTVHHIVPSKFQKDEYEEFMERDQYVHVYHTFNARATAQVELLTRGNKKVIQLPYWVNDSIWKPTASKEELRAKHGIPQDAYVILSAQRDTEGKDEISPKREKGPEGLANFLIKEATENPKCYILLAGWRRQYVLGRLAAARVTCRYEELPSQSILNEFYQCADLYPITSLHEGGPQAFLEAGALNLKVVSTPVGIAEEVLHHTSIRADVSQAIPSVPDIERFKISNGGMIPYRRMFADVLR